MSNKVKKVMKKEFERLKKSIDRILNPGKHQRVPQPLLQPIKRRQF